MDEKIRPTTNVAPGYGRLALWSLFRRVRKDHYTPEDYAAAGGELLVLTLGISWTLTFFFNPAIVSENTLRARVGYNNLCVGWDSFPARWVAAPLFALIVWCYVQFFNYDLLRQNLTQGLTMRERSVVYVANCVTGLSYCFASLIFVFDPMYYPVAHSISFIQLIFFGYFAYAANFYETDPKYHPPGAYIYLVVFGIASLSFSVLAAFQLLMYEEEMQIMGPVPWYVVATFDYLWFFCKALGSYFRPYAPSIAVQYTLVSDGDFRVVPGMQRESPRNLFSQDVPTVVPP